MMKIKLKPSILFTCLHARLLTKVNPFGNISRRKLFDLLAVTYHIPKEERCKVINELKELGIILNENKFEFSINTNLKL